MDTVVFLLTHVIIKEVAADGKKKSRTSVTGFELNDEVIFEGTIPTNTIDAITSTSYYIKTINTGTNEITISTSPGGSVVNVTVHN